MRFYIKEAREHAGLSQKELAKIIGVAPNTFHGYESGKHDPKSNLLAAIAQACNTSVDYLLGVSDECLDLAFVGGQKNSPPLSDEEIKIAKDYRALDSRGQSVVRLVIAEELKHTVEKKGVVPLPTAFRRVHPGIRGLDDDNDPKTELVSIPARDGGLVHWALSKRQLAQYNALVAEEEAESAADDL